MSAPSVIIFIFSKYLSKQGHNALIRLICLRQHRLSGLCKNIVIGEFNHLSRHIGITDSGLSSGGILHDIIQIANRVLQTVLNRTEVGSLLIHLCNSSLHIGI